MVSGSWEGSMHHDPLVNFGLKLKRLRLALRKWNWDVFGDIQTNMKALLLKINVMEGRLQHSWNDSLAQEVASNKEKYQDLVESQFAMLKAKAKMNWLEDGEHNSKLFHAAIKARRVMNKMHLDLGDGIFTDDRNVIGKAAVDFYADLFGGQVDPPPLEVLEIIPKVVNNDDNLILCAMPSMEEVLAEIKAMSKGSSPGPDGFTGQFYIHCWDIIKSDLMAAVHGFFGGLQLPHSFTSTYLTLIPKVAHATSISQLRPISLCNFCHKIISRILTSRLSSWLPCIISEEQAGFVKGRGIHENIALAHDLTHDINHKVFGGNIVIKLDMAKAYDRISWSFILGVLRKMGFGETWCDMVSRCISHCFYSVKWDGQLYGYFKSSRGVRQGDPLSPSLFVVAMEWLSKVLNAGVDHGVLKPYITKRRSVQVNHLLFADDLLIFTDGAKDSVRKLLDIIRDFCTISGQKLNPSKSNIIFPSSFPNERKTEIIRISRFVEGDLPIQYLGAPLFRGRARIDMFSHLVEAVSARIGGWMKRFLSMGGRVTLVNSVLNAIGIHNMMVLPVPITILNRLSSLMANFVWDGGGTRRRHWRSWEKLCMPRRCGGLGIRDPKSVMVALHGRLAWGFLEQKSLWARFAKARFRIGEKGSGVWNAFSHLVPSIQSDCAWKLGRGLVLAQVYCWRLGVEAPDHLKDLRIIDITGHEGHLQDLIEVIPSREAHSLSLYYPSMGRDRCIWTGHGQSSFSIRNYWEFGQTRFARPRWASYLWQRWLPPKLSCFVWKLFQRAVTTDDVVARLGIPMVSRCFCCAHPCQESMIHLFFSGDWAMDLWDWLATLFNKPRVHGIKGFEHVWLSRKPSSFMDCLAMGIACCGIWEIWKSRNTLIFEGKRRDWRHGLIAWGQNLANLISRPYDPGPGDDDCLQTLRIDGIRRSWKGQWFKWRPGIGNTLNVAIVTRGISTWGAYIARSREGTVLFGGALIVPLGVKYALPWMVERGLGRSGSLGAWTIKSSHFSARLLSYDDGDGCPADLRYLGRNLVHRFGVIIFQHICALANEGALAFAYHAPQEGHWHIHQLPRVVRVAIAGDFSGRFCSHPHSSSSPAQRDLRTSDDSVVNAVSMQPIFLDDSRFVYD
ncbi:hypothetical protein QQ045_021149 [Rhodiola kirilowii]